MKMTKPSQIKTAFFWLFLALPGFSLFALPEFTLSAGGGVTAGGFFTSYTITANEDTQNDHIWIRMKQEMRQFNIWGWLFFDATYGEFAVDIQHGFNNYTEKATIHQGNGVTDIVREGTGSETSLGLTLLGKYPFQLGEQLLLYPLTGLTYRIALTEKRTTGGREYDRTEGKTEFDEARTYPLSLWNAVLINIGAGSNFYFHDPLFLKAELLYSFRLMTSYEDAAVNWLMDTYGISRPKLFASPGMSGLTHGPELRLALGYQFK